MTAHRGSIWLSLIVCHRNCWESSQTSPRGTMPNSKPRNQTNSSLRAESAENTNSNNKIINIAFHLLSHRLWLRSGAQSCYQQPDFNCIEGRRKRCPQKTEKRCWWAAMNTSNAHNTSSGDSSPTGVVAGLVPAGYVFKDLLYLDVSTND